MGRMRSQQDAYDWRIDRMMQPTAKLPFHGGKTMSNSDLLPALLFKINENQLALEAAILELSNWVEQRGSADVADNVRGALDTMDRNEEFIKMALAVMTTPE